MSLNDFIFTSYCFDNKAAGGDYKGQQDRLKESILAIYPNANLHFVYELEEIGKPKFQKSLYGFKCQLVKDCLNKGFKKIIFFDTAMVLNDTVDYWFNIIKDYGVLAPIDRQTLDNVTSDSCLSFNGLTRAEVSDINLVGGSIYVFDFNTELCNNIFAKWITMEYAGKFGTQEDLTNGTLQNHRMDETCMALSLAYYYIQPLGHDKIKYAYLKPGEDKLHTMGELDYNPIAIKKHFK